MPSVSVCIPTYNGAPFLEACLDSVLAQTFADLEILIVDDHSTDQSYQIVQGYAARDSRIRFVRNEHNLGLVGNWNQCVLLARGEWIKFLFQDDMLESNCVEKMLAASSPKALMVACKRKVIFEDESKEVKGKMQINIRDHNMDRVFGGVTSISAEVFSRGVLDYLMLNFVGEPTAIMLHRSVFNRFGFFNPYLINICDLEYWVRVGCHTGLIYVPEILASFRRHRKAASVINENSKKFKLYMDELICLNDFVFHPLYAPLRFYASECQPPVNLKQMLAGKVKSARKMADEAAKKLDGPDSSLLDELNTMRVLFPGLDVFKKIPFSLRFVKSRWKAREFVSKRLSLGK